VGDVVLRAIFRFLAKKSSAMKPVAPSGQGKQGLETVVSEGRELKAKS
jgi:hypothetical protein